MKKIRFIIIIFFCCYNFNGNFLNAALQDKILAKVESQFISTFELKNKIKAILFLTNQEFNQENINLTKREALQSLINLKLKKEEALKFKLLKDKQVYSGANKYLSELAVKYNTDIYGFKKILISKTIDFELFFNDILTEIAWQKIILNIYKDKVLINDIEIEKELLSSVKNNKDIASFNLSEIEIILDNNFNIEEKFAELKSEISKIGFKNAAIKYSLSPSALEGGKIGWINSKSLSKNILDVLKNLKIGEVSKPIIQGNSLLILKLLDKKTISNKDLDMKKLKEKIIANKKNNLLNLFSNNHLSKVKNNALIEIK